MNRRHFLGIALCATAAPVFARRPAQDVRTLAFHHLHTDEKISVIYRVGDNYQRGALHKLNCFLRDFRTKETNDVGDVSQDVGNLSREGGFHQHISGEIVAFLTDLLPVSDLVDLFGWDQYLCNVILQV